MNGSTLPTWAEESLDAIDAGFFSGDVFHSSAAIEAAEHYIGRWTREIARIKETLAAEGVDHDPA